MTNTPAVHSLLGLSSGGFHRLRYYEWGDPANPRVVMCVHGLTRNGRDFDPLAKALSTDYRVICPDVVGRGQSEWLANKGDYGYPQYLADATTLIARLGVEQLDWVGTSMGGLIGMLLAAQSNAPVRRLILNDVGPFIPQQALQRIGDYLSIPMRFSNLEQMEQYVRRIAAPFGRLSDDQWRHLTLHSARQEPDGHYVFGYDPGIAQSFKTLSGDADMWSVWERVQCPCLVLRGAESDLLRRQDAVAMTERGPRAELIEFEHVGHAPALMNAEQIAAVERGLRQ